ncbi:anthranilate synthase component II [Mannheimia indoligenes]|uniref:anthranilate synthase component II n=1 Tax=Mannheimia indoligenes TaxID=3103145 RepID=UPI002FE56378
MQKKLLIIDNHDSFTFNLVDLLRKIKVPAKVVLVEELNLDEVEQFSHILISPGPDVPRAYPQTFAMLERYHQSKSILGVCLGHQTICEFFGGTLYNLKDVRHGQQRTLSQIEQNPIFKGLPNTFQVGLYHSWGILQNSLQNTPLVATAVCDQNVLMAFKHKNLPIYGVQFHPESFITEYGLQILQNWLDI